MSGATRRPGTQLIVTLLPRATRLGHASLVSVDLGLGQITATRRIPVDDYLPDPDQPARPLQHARGLTLDGDNLWVALFNGVRCYRITDARSLTLDAGQLLTDDYAVDLHGLEIRQRELFAVSTGADAILVWDLDTRAHRRIDVETHTTGDLRFPRTLAASQGFRDWRTALPGLRHLNDVAALGRQLVACSLRRLLTTSGRFGHWRTLWDEPGAILHDGRPAPNGRLLVTDASQGRLLAICPRTGGYESKQIASPADWFVRGVHVVGDHVVVLRSEVVPSRQRGVRYVRWPERRLRAARFGLTVVRSDDLGIEAKHDFTVGEAIGGAVAYAATSVSATVSRAAPSLGSPA